jgi:hypothetical protein
MNTDGQASKKSAESGDSVTTKNPLTIPVNGCTEWALRGSNPRPHGCDTASPPTDPQAEQSVTPTPSAACTTACTSEPKNAHGIDLDRLAAELMKLPKDERARLLAKLLAKGEGEAG